MMNKQKLEVELQEAKEQANKLLNRIQQIQDELNKPDKIELEYEEDEARFVGVSFVGTQFSGNDPKGIKHARYRDTEEQAKEALDRERQANRIEARARKIDPDWIADWSNYKQSKYTIYYDHDYSTFKFTNNLSIERIGTPVMSKTTASQLCEELNSGRYDLGDE